MGTCLRVNAVRRDGRQAIEGKAGGWTPGATHRWDADAFNLRLTRPEAVRLRISTAPGASSAAFMPATMPIPAAAAVSAGCSAPVWPPASACWPFSSSSPARPIPGRPTAGCCPACARHRSRLSSCPSASVDGLRWAIPKADRLVIPSGAVATMSHIPDRVRQRRGNRDYIVNRLYVRLAARLGPVSKAEALPRAAAEPVQALRQHRPGRGGRPPGRRCDECEGRRVAGRHAAERGRPGTRRPRKSPSS